MNRKRGIIKKCGGFCALLLLLSISVNTYAAGTGSWHKASADGVVQTGWIWHENNWYFAMPGGELASGWLNLDGKWYYMKSDGAMVTNGWRTLDGVSYYIDEKGAVATNQFIGKSYVNKDGVMDTKYDLRAQTPKKGVKIKKPTTEQYESMAEELNQLPRGIFNYFIDGGWSFVCMTDVKNYGTRSLFEEAHTVNVSVDSGTKEVRMTDTENVLLDLLDYYERTKSISSKYNTRLFDTMDLTMEEDLELGTSGTSKELVRQYWLIHTLKYMNPDERAEMKDDNLPLYTLIEEIAAAYQLN